MLEFLPINPESLDCTAGVSLSFLKRFSSEVYLEQSFPVGPDYSVEKNIRMLVRV